MDTSNGGVALQGNMVKPPSPSILSPRLSSKAGNMKRSIDEMRQHIAKLKTELETEKARYKQLHRDKIAEMRTVREKCEQDKELAVQASQSKLYQEKQVELQKLKDVLNKEKDQEIRQILRYQEENVKHLKSQLQEEKSDAVRVALEMQKRALGDGHSTPTRPSSGNSALVVRLQREIKQLKDSKKDLEEQIRLKTIADKEKLAELRQIRKEHKAELNLLLKESKQEGAKEIQQLKKAEESLLAKEQELNERNSVIKQLTFDRHELEEQLKNLGGSFNKTATSQGNQEEEDNGEDEDETADKLNITQTLSEPTIPVPCLPEPSEDLCDHNSTTVSDGREKTDDTKDADADDEGEDETEMMAADEEDRSSNIYQVSAWLENNND